MKIAAVSENALIIRFGTAIDPAILAQVRVADRIVRESFPVEVIDTIPSYASLVIVYRPTLINYDSLKKSLGVALSGLEKEALAPGNQVDIPVYYDEESGPDLARLSKEASLSIGDIIEIHSQTTYLVYAIGFAPGFAYLGEVDERIACPRLATPRLSVPAGSVAIADRQTAVYPSTGPGGWNLIGRTAFRLFDGSKEPAMLFGIGDGVRFYPVSREEFLEKGGEL